MQVTPLNSISSELASTPTRSQSSVQRTVNPQDEANFAQLSSVSSKEPMAASSTGVTNTSGGKTATTGDVLKAITASIMNTIMTQGAENRAKIEKVMREEDPE